MDRYDSLELDLECDGGGGGVAHKASLFGGMFKKSSKSTTEHLINSQDNVSVSSDSSDSLTDNNNYKDKSSVLKGMFKKTTKPTQTSLSVTNPELSASTDSLTDKSSKDKGVAMGVPPRPPPKPGHLRRPSQDFLDLERTSSNDNLTENTSSKESSGVFGGMFKKSPKPSDRRRASQDNLSTSRDLSGSQDSLTNNNTKDGGGMFGGMFKKPPKIFKRTQSQDELSEPSEPTDGQENSENTKDKGGLFGGVFKKPKGLGARAQSQENLDELSGSKEELSENNTKEKGGLLSGVFKKPKTLGAKSQSKDDLTELSNSQENLTENTKEKGLFGGVFKKPKPLGAKSQSQDDLSENTELTGSSENLTEKSSKGGVAKILKNPFASFAQDKDKTEKDKTESASKDSTTSTEKPKTKQNGFSAMMKNTFSSDKQEKASDSDSEEAVDSEEKQHSNKQQSKFAGAMTKLNPFRTAHKSEKTQDSSEEESDKPTEHKQKDTEDLETLKDNGTTPEEEKHKAVRNNVAQWEKRDRSETILIPNRPTQEEIMKASGNDEAGDRQANKEAVSKERRPQSAETPVVPPRPTAAEMNKMQKNNQTPEETKQGRLYPSLPQQQNKSDDESLSEDKPTEDKTVKVKRPKHHNPFMPRTGTKLAAVETAEEATEAETVESSAQEENKEEESNDKAETKAKKPKRRNPFMPQVKGKIAQRKGPSGAGGAENEGGNRSLFDQLEEFRFEPSQPENREDVDNLMEWWNTVDNWEDTPQFDDMTPKEEAKAFAVTAEKIQKGIRVFNKLFSERAESLWQHVIDLNAIADSLDKFNKKTKIAQITGGSTSAIGGVATIAGLALAPVTMGTSLIVTAVGLGVATAGGLTSAGAGISNQVNNSMDRKKVEKIVEDYQEKMVDLNKALKFIKQGIENLRQFDLIKMKKHAYNRDFPVLNSNFYEDGAMAGKAILINANEIMRVVQIANVAGSTAARAVQIASMATGVLTGLFVGMDIYFVAKDSKELKKGAKSEFAAKIREVAQQLHEGLVELNTIREELQATNEDGNQEGNQEEKNREGEKREGEKYDDEEEEDEIDRIKKQIKKDYENREWV